jgi:hypothetical protein
MSNRIITNEGLSNNKPTENKQVYNIKEKKLRYSYKIK